jgi:hypothetical protein
MPIPLLAEDGFLPPGVHDCTLKEIKSRFGSFTLNDARPKLFARLESYVSEAKISRIILSILVDGSFVTAKAAPNDIDLIIELVPEHDFKAELNVSEYNVLSKNRVRRKFGFDLLAARSGSPEYLHWVEFFQQVRLEPGRQKGILRVRL